MKKAAKTRNAVIILHKPREEEFSLKGGSL
jgi:hypothetical protein